LGKDSDYTLSESIRLLDLPVHPPASGRLLADQNHHGGCPGHFHPQQALNLSVAYQALVKPCLVRRLCANRTVSNVVALSIEEVGQPGDMLVVLVVVADEYVPSG
jgi:hypothetical protein